MLLLTLMTGSKVVGDYGLASTIVTFLLVIPNAFMTSVLPLPRGGAPLATRDSSWTPRPAYMTMVGTLGSLAPSVCAGPRPRLADSNFQAAALLLQILGVSVCSHA